MKNPDELNIHYPEDLPVVARKSEILEALRQHQVVVITGETGSGKTTQLPKMCLELGRKAIGHTQPRRIAARAVAERIAEELNTELGELVGYQVRFTEKLGRQTRLKIMTDGILLAELKRDPKLNRYDTIIIDEAHERSLNIDFLLGYLKKILSDRPELKVIITSATIDAEKFSAHFDSAPIIPVSGRSYPVEIRYRAARSSSDSALDRLEAQTTESASRTRAKPIPTPDQESDSDSAETIPNQIKAALYELESEPEGDTLVFLSSEAEIVETAAKLTELGNSYEVLTLYGRLSAADQHRVFTSKAPGIRIRVVLSTNVAETSLTVPGIRYVIDAGTARISRYSPRSKLQRLPIEAISKASANQRAGRAGRTAPGIAIRLYSEDDFINRPDYTEPEILRTNLASVLLKLADLNLGEITDFPFLTKPDSRGVKAGFELLRELSAVDSELRITKIGRTLARLPIDPRFSRMLVEANRRQVLREVLAIVSGLSIIDPRERPDDSIAQAEQLHSRFKVPTSDFMELLALWNYLQEQSQKLSNSQFRKLCKKEYLNYLRVREWRELYRQLSEVSSGIGFRISSPNSDPDAIHRSILAGLLSNLGLLDRRELGRSSSANPAQKSKESKTLQYLGTRNRKFVLFPASRLSKNPPEAVMSAELVETKRVFARMNAKINPAWAEELAGDLALKSYSEPQWSSKSESAFAYEKVTLFGLTLVARRRVLYSKINPEHAHELFIQHALVQGQWTSKASFIKQNVQFLDWLAKQNAKTRQFRSEITEDQVFEFYRSRIPVTISDSRSFDRWWRDEKLQTPELLTMKSENFLAEAAAENDSTQFPDHLMVSVFKLKLDYNFDPGSAIDGVTVTVPALVLQKLKTNEFDWLVPGLRLELVTALIKSLPKLYRRSLVPSQSWAEKILEETPNELSQVPLLSWFQQRVKTLSWQSIPEEELKLDRLPSHLRPRYLVLDQNGKKLGAGRDLLELQKQLKPNSESSPGAEQHNGGKTQAPQLNQTNVFSRLLKQLGLESNEVTSWTFDQLPEELTQRSSVGEVTLYLGLERKPNGTVWLSTFSTRAEAELSHKKGTASLLAQSVPDLSDYLVSQLNNAEKLALSTSGYQSLKTLFKELTLALAAQHLETRMVRSISQFEAERISFNQNLNDRLVKLLPLLVSIFSQQRGLLKTLSQQFSGLNFVTPNLEIKSQLEQLIYPGFVAEVGLEKLVDYPRYLKAIEFRLQKLVSDPVKDQQFSAEYKQAAEAYAKAAAQTVNYSAKLDQVRWLLEELRVSLFAQQLGTKQPVSVARIKKLLNQG